MNGLSSLGQSLSGLISTLTGLFIVTSALILTGCATPTPPLSASPAIPANLRQPCPPLTPLSGKTGADVLRKIIEVSGMYYECADGKQKLIDATK